MYKLKKNIFILIKNILIYYFKFNTIVKLAQRWKKLLDIFYVYNIIIYTLQSLCDVLDQLNTHIYNILFSCVI